MYNSPTKLVTIINVHPILHLTNDVLRTTKPTPSLTQHTSAHIIDFNIRNPTTQCTPTHRLQGEILDFHTNTIQTRAALGEKSGAGAGMHENNN